LENEQDEDMMPSFMKDEETEAAALPVGGAFRGTAYHRLLEVLDFSKIPDVCDLQWVKTQTSAILQSGRLSKEQYDRINPYDVRSFISSELGQRMRQAARRHQLEREAQFVIGIPANRMDEKVSSEELVLVQGVIDAWFEEDGQLVLVDYKTDHVPKEGGEAILLKRYRRQLDYYQYALEQITGKKVKDRLIYSFTLKTVICG
jgi:ATP-dependent helicase/nuclease subunit A